jgi:teichuronic acid biosynthesis glycosyltransferase TuaC
MAAASHKPPRKLPRPGAKIVTLERQNSDPHLLIVTNLWPHEENERYGIFVQRQVDSLVRAGLRCDVLMIHGHKSRLAYPLAALKLLWWSMRSSSVYPVVHAHGGEVVPFARAYLRAPLVASYLGEDLNGTSNDRGARTRRYRLKSATLRQLSRLTALTITKSREMQTRLPGSVRRRNTVIPNGVDRRTFAPIDRSAARESLGWDPSEFVVLFVANPAVARKRHRLAEEVTRQAGAQMKLRLHVGFPVDPEIMPTVMSASDCLLLTSSAEGSPNVVKEALACNLPVVATRVGDVEELLAGVEPARVCSDDPRELADAVILCLEQGRRSNGRKMTEHLDDEVIARRLIELYRGLVPGLSNSSWPEKPKG